MRFQVRFQLQPNLRRACACRARFLSLFVLLLLAARFASAQTNPRPAAGGGFLGGGLRGAYYPTSDFSGSPAFVRTDVRVDFDWGASAGFYPSVSGTSSYTLSAANFSVRWQGKLTPKYTETYTFKTITDDGVRLSINGQDVINHLTAHAVTTDTAQLVLRAGKVYSVALDYFQSGGPAVCRLHWASPSTPEEAIEPVTPLGINSGSLVDYDPGLILSDAIKSSRSWTKAGTGDQPVALDAQGWPLADARIFVGDTHLLSGTYKLVFNGKASVQPGAFIYSGVAATPVSYDAASNISVWTVTLGASGGYDFPGSNSLWIDFYSTQHDSASATNTGIRNVRLFRPTSVGATTSIADNQLFNPAYVQLMTNFSVIRFMDYLATNSNPTKTWADRTLPGAYSQANGPGGSWEYLIELCNESGRDAYINLPQMADDTYLHNVALMFRYGSDGLNPYPSPQANPAYSPLNPNLKVYVEYSNEVWNFGGGFDQSRQNQQEALDAVQNNTPVGQLINYDGQASGNENARRQRYHALRTKAASDQFRSVFGDDAMGQRIRVLVEWQYGGGWYGEDYALRFLNAYYNNGDGIHVTTPRPVNYYVWGAGGGWYSGTTNEDGAGGVPVVNGSFENGTTGWTFSASGSGVLANGDSPTHPNALDGAKVAYLSGDGASFQQTVTAPKTDYGEIRFNVVLSARPQDGIDNDNLDVFWDGVRVTQITQYINWFITDQYLRYTGDVFRITPGAHTIQFVSHGRLIKFIDTVRVSSVDAMYNGATTTPIDSVKGDVSLAQSYGLYDVGYEGGFRIGGDQPSKLDYIANVDGHARNCVLKTLDEFFHDGGVLPVVFNAVGGAYAIAADPVVEPLSNFTALPSVYGQDAPKLRGYQQATQVPLTTPRPQAAPITKAKAGVFRTFPHGYCSEPPLKAENGLRARQATRRKNWRR